MLAHWRVPLFERLFIRRVGCLKGRVSRVVRCRQIIGQVLGEERLVFEAGGTKERRVGGCEDWRDGATGVLGVSDFRRGLHSRRVCDLAILQVVALATSRGPFEDKKVNILGRGDLRPGTFRTATFECVRLASVLTGSHSRSIRDGA